MAAESALAKQTGAEVALKEKAVFFVKDFKGNRKTRNRRSRGGEAGAEESRKRG
jgi:hypothetical protein